MAMTLAAVLPLALMQGCTRIETLTPPVEEEVDAITFAPSIASTKGLLNASTLSQSGTQILVYDFLTGFSGELSGHSGTIGTNDVVKYFSDNIAYDASTSSYWPFANGNVYPWTKSGQHSFFGWLVQSGDTMPASHVTELFHDGTALSFNESTRVLTVPATGLTTSSAKASTTVSASQFDFSYSDVTTVNAATRAAGSNSVVPMQLKHFFGAIGITITNNSDKDVKVYSVQLKNFPNVGSGTIQFNTGESPSAVATYANPVTVGNDPYQYWPNKITTPITLYNKDHATEANKVYDASNSAVLADDVDPQFFLAWPMYYSALEPVVQSVDDEGVVTYSADSPLIEVKYGDTSSTAQTASTFTYRFPKVNNPNTTGAIIAGKKYLLELSFADHQVVVSFNQLPWTYEQYPMAYEGDAISTTQLKFTENTFVNGGKYTDANGKHDVIQLTSASTAGQYIAKGTFKIYTPVNGVLTVGTSGNTEDFIVTLESGTSASGIGTGSESITINPHRDGGQVTLTVRPKGTPSSGSRIFLHFVVRNNGRDSDADTEINRDNYMITIP